MELIELIEKFSALATNAFTSYPSITANIFVASIILVTHNLFPSFYAKLNLMNNPLFSIAILLFTLSFYALLLRFISACFRLGKNTNFPKRKNNSY